MEEANVTNTVSVIEPESASKPLVTTFSPLNNSYQSRTGNDVAVERASSNNIANSTNNAKQQTDKRKLGREGGAMLGGRRLLQSLLGSLNAAGKTNCLPNCLLAASLVASVLNTLLLSFVVKSIQLNDVSKQRYRRKAFSIHPPDC